MKSSLFSSLLPLFLYILPSIVYGWDKDIHERIGEAVTRVLSYRDVEDLNKLLNGQSIAYMSRYAHDKLQYANYDRTVENHYETQLRDWKCTFDINNPDSDSESQGLYKSIHDIFGRVTHQSKPAQDHGIAKDMSEPVQISWLLGLVQDLHQPLHTGFGADDHGRRITVQYHDEPRTSLYDFWERDVSSAVNLETQVVLRAYNAELDKLVQDGGYGIKLVQSIYNKGIAEWIAESMEMSCNDIYAVIAGGKGREVPRMYDITDDVYAQWRDLASKQVVKAAARSAVVLHAIAIHARYYHPEIVGSISKPGAKIQRHRVRGNWMQALAKNSAIALVVVPTLLVLLNYPQFVRRLLPSKDNRAE